MKCEVRYLLWLPSFFCLTSPTAELEKLRNPVGLLSDDFFLIWTIQNSWASLYSDFDPNDINGGRINKTSVSTAAVAATDVRKERYLLEYIG